MQLHILCKESEISLRKLRDRKVAIAFMRSDEVRESSMTEANEHKSMHMSIIVF